MKRTGSSITDLKAQVDKIAEFKAHFQGRNEELAHTRAAAAFAEVLDKPLVLWVEQLWPQAGQWAVKGVDLQGLEALCAGLAKARGDLADEVGRRASLFEKAREQVENLQKTAFGRERMAQRDLEAAKRSGTRFDKAVRLCRRQAQAAEQERDKLAAWLQGVEPLGILGLRDAQGKPVTHERVRMVNQEAAELKKRIKQREIQAAEFGRAAMAAKDRIKKAEENLARARQARQAEAKAQIGRRARLDQAGKNLKATRTRLEGIEQSELKAVQFKHAFSVFLSHANSIITQELAGAAAGPAFEPGAALQSYLGKASAAETRTRRLGGILVGLEQNLARRGAAAGGLLSEVREINREINRIEGGLPAALKNLNPAMEVDETARAQAAASISTIIAQIENLLPRAHKAQDGLTGLRVYMRRSLDRSKAWQKQWRQSAKEQRACLAQAAALLEEIRLAGGAVSGLRRDMLQDLGPLIQWAAQLGCQDLLPSVALIAHHARDLSRKAKKAEAEGEELAAKIPPPAVANLSSAPAAFKPHSATLRRLSGRQVELSRLEALADSCIHWKAMLSRPVEESIRRPAEEVAQRLSASLSLMASERARLDRARGRTARRMRGLRSDLREQDRAKAYYKERLKDLSRSHGRQRRELLGLRRELEKAQKGEALARELSERLYIADHTLAKLDQRLGRFEAMAQALKAKALERHSLLSLARSELADMRRWRQAAALRDRRARALKAKAIERHRLLQEARRALDSMSRWQKEAEHQQWMLHATRSELEQAREEAARARELMLAATSERDQALEEYNREKQARARQAVDLLEGAALSMEVAATQSEVGRWAALAGQLGAALSATGLAHRKETAELRGRIDQLTSEAAALKDQLNRISQMVALADLASSGKSQAGPVGVRITPMDSKQVDRTLDRLASVRSRLRKIGSSTLGLWALAATLTAGLLLVAPSTPSKATLAQAPLTPQRAVLEQRLQRLVTGPRYQVPAEAGAMPMAMGLGSLQVDLLPLRGDGQPLPAKTRELVSQLAGQAGLSGKVLLTSARALYGTRQVVEPEALRKVAETAKALASRHPLIFRELAGKGLPANASALAAVKTAPEEAQHLFLDRLYREYRSLGFSAEEALGALATNEQAAQTLHQKWRPPKVYSGACRPVPAIERMNLPSFLDRLTPYIKGKLRVFLRKRSMTYSGDLDRYAKNLAFDMYCAAKKYQVPVTFLLAIAHQETWYANVLGDANRSASPFQIYEPTRQLIRASMRRSGFVPPPKGVRLERHLTMATYMAAFHLRELMQSAYVPAAPKRPARVDMYKVLLRYNGSRQYPGRVAKRQKALARFMAGKS